MSTASKPKHAPIREEWLALRSEEAIDPGRPVIDAHHHLWDKPGSRYLLDEMWRDLATGHTVVATVCVEGKTGYRTDGPPELRSLGETDLVAEVAEASAARLSGAVRIAAGIVAFVDLMLGDAAGPLLDLHIEAARGRLRGVRNASVWHADPQARGSAINQPPGMLYEPSFRAGLSELAKRGLVLDAWMYHTQLNDLADLAHDMPELSIVLDHVGGPIGIGPYAELRDEVREDWRYVMRKLARQGNIAVKLGGFGMPMAGFDFHARPLPPTSDELAQAWAAYMKACIDIFGPSRCMFESNFPVDKGTTSYPVLWNAFKRIAKAYSEPEQHALFFETANSTYRLGLDPPP